MRDDELEKIILHLQVVRNYAYEHYSKAVDSMMKNGNAKEYEVEYLMDGLLDFCDEKRFVDAEKLYSKFLKVNLISISISAGGYMKITDIDIRQSTYMPTPILLMRPIMKLTLLTNSIWKASATRYIMLVACIGIMSL